MVNKKLKTEFLNKVLFVKKNLTSMVKNPDLKKLQKNVKSAVSNAKTEFKGLVNKDIYTIKKKFLLEKKQMEGVCAKVLKNEVQRLNKFISTQQKELTKLEKTLDKLSGMKEKVAKKKTTKKKLKAFNAS